MDRTLHNVLESLLFTGVGFLVLFAGYRLFDRLTPTDLNEDIFKKGNTAAAILTGSFMIALAIVIHAALS